LLARGSGAGAGWCSKPGLLSVATREVGRGTYGMVEVAASRRLNILGLRMQIGPLGVNAASAEEYLVFVLLVGDADPEWARHG